MDTGEAECADPGSAREGARTAPFLLPVFLLHSALPELRETLPMGLSHLCSLISSGLSSEAPWIASSVISALTGCRKL